MWKKIILGVLLILSAVTGFFVAKAQVAVIDDTFGHMHRDYKTALSKVDLSGIKVNSDSDIVNVLLVGNDKRKEKHYNADGLTDVMMIATLDMKHKALKLTSLMRDTEVDIPGYGNAKLNSAQTRGGIQLLYKTIAENFNIKLDGYVEVEFKAFERIVNRVGGIDVELTESEAHYLNTTNYIINKKYRNVKAGINHLNGSQALGYCRIRKSYILNGQRVIVRTITGKADDYGRTWRQRYVMSEIFSKVKKLSAPTWLSIAKDIFGHYVKTDLSSSNMTDYLKDVIFMGTTKVHQMQIPVNGYFSSSTHGSNLVMDKTANAEALNEFIFKYDGEGAEYQYNKGTPTSTP